MKQPKFPITVPVEMPEDLTAPDVVLTPLQEAYSLLKDLPRREDGGFDFENFTQADAERLDRWAMMFGADGDPEICFFGNGETLAGRRRAKAARRTQPPAPETDSAPVAPRTGARPPKPTKTAPEA